MKKLFIISAVLLVVVLIFLGIYNFAFKKDVPVISQTVNQKTEETAKTEAPIKREKIRAITDKAVLGVAVDKKTEKVKYYETQSGTAWEMDADGQKKRQLSEVGVTGLKSVSWSPDKNKVITMTEENGQNSFYLYDYVAKKGTLLKKGLDTAVWDNLGTKIFYKYFDSKTALKTLNVANPDGGDWQKISDVTERNLVIAPLPLTSIVSFWNRQNALEETRLQIVGVTGGEAKIILNGRYGADYLWSPRGDKALVSSLQNKDAKNITLGVVDIAGQYQDLNIPTMASKCAWSEDNKTLYYALPGEIPTGSLIPNDYQENKFNTSDTFWKVDTSTGEKERVVEVSDIKDKYDADKLLISATEDAVYFINKRDQRLYRIQL